MIDSEDIDGARKILGLDEYATLDEIKKTYRSLAWKYHPDRYRGKKKAEREEMFKKIAHSKDVLLHYCARYRYSFKEKDVRRSLLDKETFDHLVQFYDGWVGEV